ncbi:MAG TPA: hypothetical protein DHU96_35185 [Actinobacteria bacterium]|nr:hypothetical protein [Actinomycetota bacterium]
MSIRLRFWHREGETMAGEIEPRAEGGNLSIPMRVAVEVRNAAAELMLFGHSVRSLGLASWTLGVGFAVTAVGLRFLNGTDMAAPEFVACFVFASLLVAFGIVVYILESRGYLKLVSEIAVKRLDEPDGEKNGGGGEDNHGD